jgi:hypothetical protein
MKITSGIGKLISPGKACSLIVLAVFGASSAQAEYYYVDDAPFEKSAKCVSVKRHKCAKNCYTQRPVVNYVTKTPTCGTGCYNYYSSCPTCNNTGEYYTSYTRYAYVCDECQNNYWVPGYACCGRWVAGHWRY